MARSKQDHQDAIHYDLLLVSHIIESGDMRTPLRKGIEASHFTAIDAKSVYRYLCDYYQSPDTRNLVPTWDMVESRFPGCYLPEPSSRHTVDSLCALVRSNWLRQQLDIMIDDALDACEESPEKALENITSACKNLTIANSKTDTVSIVDYTDKILDDYLMVEQNKGSVGLPYPKRWGYYDDNGQPKINKNGRHAHPLNIQTGGMLDEEFVFIYGRPKSLKTWILLNIAVESYLEEHARVLVVTTEMSLDLMFKRSAALMSGIDYAAMKQGCLNGDDRLEFIDTLSMLRDEEERWRGKLGGRGPAFIITRGAYGVGADGLTDLQGKIDCYKPDVVLVDSFYRMKTGGRTAGLKWQDVSTIAYGLHDLAETNKIPIVGTSQANRDGEEIKGGSMREIAFGDSIAQALDLSIRVIKLDPKDGHVPLAMVISGAREIQMAGFMLNAELCRDIWLERRFDSERQVQAFLQIDEENAQQELDMERQRANKSKLNTKNRMMFRTIRDPALRKTHEEEV